jgi:Notch-like protein
MKRKTVVFSILSILCCLLLPSALRAVVNQVNGQVVPVQLGSPCPQVMDECIQTGLNYGEGINPPNSPPTLPGPVNAVLDANTGPEIFLVPKTAGNFNSVTFRLLQEGAGFENIFGWYNVDDPSKRYPVIFSCRGGNRSTYEPPAYSGTLLAGGYSISVNFENEFLAGRYTGKQIGFYLISPEGSANRNAGGAVNNCATDPFDQGTLTSGGEVDDDNYNENDGQDDDNGYGRLYYTESKLNNDGNYVHYLIYQSKKDSKHYYFGFEDLFRGGDNDYDDTLVKVEGLVPTCLPSQEICNGVDDNCNGQIDENVFRACTSLCGSGQEQCKFTNDGNASNDWINCTALKPVTEICNGVDDDCDGSVDDGVPGGGACSASGCTGQLICSGGKLICNAPAPSNEVCDGKDNDCNGTVDDGLTRACTSLCGNGTEKCQFSNDGNASNDWVNCTALKPKTEVCNGVDDDCDGSIDDGVASGGACSLSGCTGTFQCVGGKMVCDAPAPTGELCDGKDNDCDGKIDENVTRPCSTICGVGTEQCQFSNDGNTANDWINCSAPKPATEVCNGKDDDCDGAVDDNLSVGPACSIGSCTGNMQCVAGKMVCDAATPSVEICDGKDNNCNGQTDENLIRSCLSSCGFGTEQCKFTDDGNAANDWINCTAPKPATEVCDGVDNDCNGQVDDGVPGEGLACDHASGKTCKQGLTKCVGGKMTCFGATTPTTEICDCKDNDCDSKIDEDNPCPQGTKCIKCGCRIPCTGGEFGCPKDFACVEGYCIPDTCAGVSCKPDEKCKDGICISLCAGVTCKDGETCQGGLCVGDTCYAKGCAKGQVCLKNKCQPDPCAGVSCPDKQFCSGGACKPSCGAVNCGKNALCVDGKCLGDPCGGVTCGPNVPCRDGVCDEACETVLCPSGQVCEKGGCVDDPCQTVRCFAADETCQGGQCISGRTYIGTRSEILAAGSGGLACSVPRTVRPPGALWPLLLLGLVWLRRRVGR